MGYYQMAAALGGSGGRLGAEPSALGEVLLLAGLLVFCFGLALLFRAPSIRRRR